MYTTILEIGEADHACSLNPKTNKSYYSVEVYENVYSGCLHISQTLAFYNTNFGHRILKCDIIILQTFPFEPLNLIMRYTQLL